MKLLMTILAVTTLTAQAAAAQPEPDNYNWPSHPPVKPEFGRTQQAVSAKPATARQSQESRARREFTILLRCWRRRENQVHG
jgi:hypothetical protein